MKVNKWTMASCSRYPFSPTCSSLLQIVFQQFLFFSSLTFFKYYPTARTLPQICSYSVTFVSKDSALSFSVAAETLNPKGLIAKNKSQSRENTKLKTLKCVSWSKMDGKSCTKSNFCTENKKTNSPFYEAAKLLVFTVATSGRRCGIMLISSKNWTFHFLGRVQSILRSLLLSLSSCEEFVPKSQSD